MYFIHKKGLFKKALLLFISLFILLLTPPIKTFASTCHGNGYCIHGSPQICGSSEQTLSDASCGSGSFDRCCIPNTSTCHGNGYCIHGSPQICGSSEQTLSDASCGSGSFDRCCVASAPNSSPNSSCGAGDNNSSGNGTCGTDKNVYYCYNYQWHLKTDCGASGQTCQVNDNVADTCTGGGGPTTGPGNPPVVAATGVPKISASNAACNDGAHSTETFTWNNTGSNYILVYGIGSNYTVKYPTTNSFTAPISSDGSICPDGKCYGTTGFVKVGNNDGSSTYGDGGGIHFTVSSCSPPPTASGPHCGDSSSAGGFCWNPSAHGNNNPISIVPGVSCLGGGYYLGNDCGPSTNNVCCKPNPSGPTPTPGPTTAKIGVKFDGIDGNNNTTPKHLQRLLTIYLYSTNAYTSDPTGARPTYKATDTITFQGGKANSSNSTFGMFGSFDFQLGKVLTGDYYVLLKSPEGSLREILSTNKIHITAGQNNVLVDILNSNSQVTIPQLRMGDLNNDNSVDANDYAILRDCYGNKKTQSLCTNHNVTDTYKGLFADSNDDSVVDGIDYNIILRNINSHGY